jgi:hypothetical protein
MQRILSVKSVSVFILRSDPPQVGITADGDVPTSGWTQPSLSPWFYVVPPADGIQDFDFVAEPPTGIVLPVVSPISVHAVIARDPKDYWGKGKPLKGVRIHARENSIVATLDEKKILETARLSALPSDSPSPWPWLAPGVHLGGDNTFPWDAHCLSKLIGYTVRLYHTGDPLTRDLRPDRFDIELDPTTERIVRVWFG